MADDLRALDVQLMRPDDTWVDVGRLMHVNEITRFETFPEYWYTRDRPVLGQIFEEYGGSWRPSQRVALPNWFSHLLPEGYIRSLVSNALDVNDKREFFLLEHLGGDDLPGALRVVEIGTVDGELEHPDESPGDEHDDDDPAFLKFSLAGVQPKFSLFMDNQKGLAIPAHGQIGDWILKLPDGRLGFDGVPEAEFGSLEVARSIGIDVPETRLLPAATVKGLPPWLTAGAGDSFAIGRFDRRPGGRVHAEVLAQVLDIPTANDRAKYRRANFETVASLIVGLCGPSSLATVIDRLVLNVLLGNGDAHLKNWALIYPDGRTPQISPLFDVVPTVLYIPDDDMGLKLNGSRRFMDVTVRSFDRIATRVDDATVDEVRGYVVDATDRVVANWDQLRDYLRQDQYSALTKRRDRLPLLRLNQAAKFGAEG